MLRFLERLFDYWENKRHEHHKTIGQTIQEHAYHPIMISLICIALCAAIWYFAPLYHPVRGFQRDVFFDGLYKSIFLYIVLKFLSNLLFGFGTLIENSQNILDELRCTNLLMHLQEDNFHETDDSYEEEAPIDFEDFDENDESILPSSDNEEEINPPHLSEKNDEPAPSDKDE